MGFRNPGAAFRNPTNSDWNPESKFPLQGLESNTWNPESTAWNPESKSVLVLPTWGENGFMKRQVLFFNGKGKNYKIKNSGIARAPPRKESNIFVTVEMILANFLIIKHTEVSSTILVKVN